MDWHSQYRKPDAREHIVLRIALILQYEPSWIAECVSAVGITSWSVLSWYTDMYRLQGWDWFMPGVGIVFGPLRAFLLFHLTLVPRSLAAAAGAVWWAWLYYSMELVWGPVPGEAGFAALFVGDILTAAKFSYSTLHANATERRVSD